MTNTPESDPSRRGDLPVLDRELLQDVLDSVPAEQAVVLLRAFRRTSRQLIDDMEQAVERDDLEALYSAAHALRGASGALGLSELESYCADIEKACRNGKPQTVYQLLCGIGDMISNANTVISVHLGDQDGTPVEGVPSA